MNEMSRNLWSMAYAVFVKWWPQNQWFPFAGYACAYFANRIGAETAEHIVIDRNVTFPSKTHMGDYARIGHNCELHGVVHLGNHVLMAPEVVSYNVNHEHGSLSSPTDLQGDATMEPIYVGIDVWLGRRVMMMPGVHIGDDGIIGAGAVVTKDLPPYSVGGGVSCRVIGSRLSS